MTDNPTFSGDWLEGYYPWFSVAFGIAGAITGYAFTPSPYRLVLAAFGGIFYAIIGFQLLLFLTGRGYNDE